MPKTYSKISGPSWATVQSNGALILKPDATSTNSTVVVQVTDGVNTFSKSIAIVLSNRSETQYFSVVQPSKSRLRIRSSARILSNSGSEQRFRLKLNGQQVLPLQGIRFTDSLDYTITGGGGGGW